MNKLKHSYSEPTSTNCRPGWEESPHLKHCYQFNTDKRGFFDAFKTCLYQDSMPVSVVTPTEQAYISGEYFEILYVPAEIQPCKTYLENVSKSVINL